MWYTINPNKIKRREDNQERSVRRLLKIENPHQKKKYTTEYQLHQQIQLVVATLNNECAGTGRYTSINVEWRSIK